MKYDDLRANVERIDVRVSAKWNHFYHKMKLNLVRRQGERGCWAEDNSFCYSRGVCRTPSTQEMRRNEGFRRGEERV